MCRIQCLLFGVHCPPFLLTFAVRILGYNFFSIIRNADDEYRGFFPSKNHMAFDNKFIIVLA